MDNREKIYEHGGELRNVQDLFEITANHAHYLISIENGFPEDYNHSTLCYMMYKGHRGLILGVSGDLKFGILVAEVSGDGLDEFFSTLNTQIHTARIIFLMDMKMSVAHRITYQDRGTVKTERIIDVMERKRNTSQHTATSGMLQGHSREAGSKVSNPFNYHSESKNLV